MFQKYTRRVRCFTVDAGDEFIIFTFLLQNVLRYATNVYCSPITLRRKNFHGCCAIQDVLEVRSQIYSSVLRKIIYFLVSYSSYSSVGIATSYALHGPGIESRIGPTQPPTEWVEGFLPGDKAAGAWR